jgi:TRAP-type C4-dicarboxylate transport system substrate-binding protein
MERRTGIVPLGGRPANRRPPGHVPLAGTSLCELNEVSQSRHCQGRLIDSVVDDARPTCRNLVYPDAAVSASDSRQRKHEDVRRREESLMGTARSTRRGRIAASVLAATTLVVAGCGGGGTPEGGAAENVKLTVATSQNEQTPNYYCGVELLQKRLQEANVGFTVELFPASQLGPDADRFPLVQAGDIDIDLQGASALSSTYEPIGVVDATYAFNDTDHAFNWIDKGSEGLFSSFQEATGVKIVDGWFFGNRTFTTKEVEVRKPDDLKGVPIRFPNSPAFLANAQALGVTNPVTVAVEELYTALQQGIAVGQENPIVATRSSSYDEVLNVAVLNNHNVGIHWILVSGKTYEKMNDEQAALLEKTIHEIRQENRDCVDEATEKILNEYRANTKFTVIEQQDIDMEAFITKSEAYFKNRFTGETLEEYQAIRELAG